MEVKTKICPCCGRVLPLSEFFHNKSLKSGHATYCKECEKLKKGKKYTITQQGIKATLCLSDFDDTMIFAELRRRGYTGELRQSKVIAV